MNSFLPILPGIRKIYYLREMKVIFFVHNFLHIFCPHPRQTINSVKLLPPWDIYDP